MDAIECQVGDEVYDAADHKIGEVVASDGRSLTVEHGVLRKEKVYVPMNAVKARHDSKIYLNVSQDASAT